jgi:alpha-L-arabinofuranosidase
VGDIREVDWNNNRGLTDDAKNNLRLLIDETNSNERYIRIPWQSQNNKDADRGDILKYIILETLNSDTLIECKELIDKQLGIISSLKVNSFIQRASEFDDISIDDIINALTKIKEERNK